MPRKWKMILIVGGVVLLVASLVGVYLLVNQEENANPAKSANSASAPAEEKSPESLSAPPVEQVVEALNTKDKDTLETYFPEEFRGQDGWTVEDIIGDGTFIVGDTPDPDNAISRTYEAWTEAEDGTTISEFELVFVYYGDHWLIAKFEAVNAN